MGEFDGRLQDFGTFLSELSSLDRPFLGNHATISRDGEQQMGMGQNPGT